MAGRVLVLHLTFEEVRHRLETTVRMVGRAYRLSRAIVDGAHLIEEQKRVDQGQSLTRVGTADDEATSLRLTVGGDDAADRTELTHRLKLTGVCASASCSGGNTPLSCRKGPLPTRLERRPCKKTTPRGEAFPGGWHCSSKCLGNESR